MTASTLNRGRNRLIVLLIALISIVPFAFAWYFAKNPEWVKERTKSNHGHLIEPARPLDYAELMGTPITDPANLDEIKGRWIMLQVASGPVCGKECMDTAEKTGRIRLMLNKEIPRVRRLLMFPIQNDAASALELASKDPTLIMTVLSESLRRRLEEAMGTRLKDGAVLLLDPFANLLMWYEPGFDPYGALRDLQRLLRISQIG